MLHENSRDSITFQPSRSNNRSRCSRLIASSLEHNVCKGSRQNGSVTSGERVALAAWGVGRCVAFFFMYSVGRRSFAFGNKCEETLLLNWGLERTSRGLRALSPPA